MRIQNRLLRRRPLVTLLTLTAIAGASALAARARRGADPMSGPVISLSTALADTATPALLTVEQLTLRPTGFYPAALSRPKGKFLLVVNNRAGLEEVDLSLSREVGNNNREKVKGAKVHRKLLDWVNEADLQPGSYVVTEASNPNWVCRITITPQ
jgi:hypothetical protein